MAYSTGQGLIAVRAGDGWVLKPACDGSEVEASALAVRAGGEWIVSPVGSVDEETDLLCVRSGADNILLPLNCPDEGGGCTGNDPLCDSCPCEANLPLSPVVTISGFPAICTVDTFNGAWTLAHSTDCIWQYDITDYHRVTLSYSGGIWQVAWSVTSPGGAFGHYTGAGDECDPVNMVWTYADCYNPWGCWNMCAGIQAAGVVLVG